MSQHLTASSRIALAQQRRVRHRRGVRRAKVVAGVFLTLFVLGLIAGFTAPGA